MNLRIAAADALARRLDALQIELDQQLAQYRGIAARLDAQLGQSPEVEIGDLAAEVDSPNQLFESVELISPEKVSKI